MPAFNDKQKGVIYVEDSRPPGLYITHILDFFTSGEGINGFFIFLYNRAIDNGAIINDIMKEKPILKGVFI